jgi:succinyl-CoA synthetase alpha subunit
MDRLVVRRDTYHDSVFLMSLSAELARSPGLEAGHVVLATATNRQLLEREGFDRAALESLGPTDMVIALRAGDELALRRAEARIDTLLRAQHARGDGDGARARPVGLDGGLRALPGANLALISVPGEYAAYEAAKALERGLHVMIFSDNVSVADEVALKSRARERGLLVMGPDCGTALVGGKPLGFANRLRRGPIGLVGASGTGLQEVSCQIHRLGLGVSHILGTGGRDLSADVGALTTLAALELLAADAATRVLVLVSKPPAHEVAARVIERLGALDKPSVVIFLGDQPRRGQGPVHIARSLADAAWHACSLAEGRAPAALPELDGEHDPRALAATLGPEQGVLHGLFCGGTLASEALICLRDRVGPILSNLHLGAGPPLAARHTLSDLGDDEYTRGRPHPMIEPTLRCEHIVRLGGERETALVLLDLVLGSGSHADPAGVTAPAIREARQRNPRLLVVASVTGTELDAQGLDRQQATLRDAGALVLPSNLAAASLAARVIAAKRAGGSAEGTRTEGTRAERSDQ